MQLYIIRRLALTLPTLLAASIILFTIMHVLPGDVARSITGDVPVAPEVHEALRDELGLNDPLFTQYNRWLISMLNGKFGGHSLETNEPIASILSRQLPVTVLLASYTLVLSIIISIPLGIIAGVYQTRWIDKFILLATLSGSAIPSLAASLIILLVLLICLNWSPPITYTTPWNDIWNHIQMLAWPTLILTWQYSSHIIRITRTCLIEALEQPYVTTAYSKGLPKNTIVIKHAFVNALIPIATMLGLQFGGLLGGAIIVETIFGLPGIGRGFVNAALIRDYNVVQSFAFLLICAALGINLLIDIFYRYINPRINQDS